MTSAGAPAAPAARRPRSAPELALITLVAAALVAGLLALGAWQVQRRAWKLALIARVDRRVHAAPTPAPGPAAWPTVTAARDGYLRVRARGVFLYGAETRVQAVTERGPGFWVMTPLRTDRGFTVLVNRGFVPPERADPATRRAGQPAGEVQVVGLLRITEPRGGFLRRNDPADGRWYSRDVAAIAADRRLTDVAPYFIDADAAPNRGGLPVGGLTVISFPNSHLVYALTWFGLAAMTAGAWGYLMREERRARREGPAREEAGGEAAGRIG